MNSMNGMENDIITNMAEGVMTVDSTGRILTVNPAGEQILSKKSTELIGRRFAACFFEYEENDAFNQVILDAIYDHSTIQDCFVSYYTGEKTLQLHLITSLLIREGKNIGLILVFTDVSELFELRDAMEAARMIHGLNKQLQLRNELLSKTFGRYLSDDIVRQLMDTDHGLDMGGKKEYLTVMMSDLRGFTALSERMAPDELLTMLNHYLGEMTDIIQNHRGTIIEFIGDGIMAIYGAPQPVKDHAAQSVAAAIEMQEKMKDVNAWNKAHGYPELQMGIGLNTGDVIIGNIGSEKRTKYGVTGSEVNLCGRIESYTIGGQVLISEATKAEIIRQTTSAGTATATAGTAAALIASETTAPESSLLQIADSFEVIPKGKMTPMTIHRVEGIGGKYNQYIREIPDEMTTLQKPVPIIFSTISGKDVSEIVHDASFTALGPDGAEITTELALKKYDNIMIRLDGQLYAKVMAADKDHYRLHFTSCPVGFDEYCKQHTGQ